jgi:hypothetical protein
LVRQWSRSRPERSEERRIVRIVVIAASVAALTLVAAGCGGSDSEGDSTMTIETDATAAGTGATDTIDATDTTDSPDTSDSDDDVSLEGCTKLTELSAKFAEALGSATGGSAGPDLEATARAYEEFADEVPEEIRDAFKTVAAAFATYAEVLGDIDLSAGGTPDPDTLQKLAEAAEKLDDAKLTAASAEIEAWAKNNCSG